jgi:hypothetical protein
VNPIFKKKSDSAAAAAVAIAERPDPALAHHIEDRVEVVGTPPGIFARMVTRAELAFNGLLIDPRSLCIFEGSDQFTVGE